MELLLPLLAALLVSTGIFLILSKAMIRLIIGLNMLAYGVNIAILLSGGVELEAPPILSEAGRYVDPLPQALILTAIVIGFGTTALLLVLSVKAYQRFQTDHVQELLEKPDELPLPAGYADPERPSVVPEVGSNAPRNNRKRQQGKGDA